MHAFRSHRSKSIFGQQHRHLARVIRYNVHIENPLHCRTAQRCIQKIDIASHLELEQNGVMATI